MLHDQTAISKKPPAAHFTNCVWVHNVNRVGIHNKRKCGQKPLPRFAKTLNWHQPLRWRHNDHAGVSNHQPHGCLLNRLFRRKSKKTSKLRVTGLCAGNSPGTGEFPAQMASYAENVSIWWRHHDTDGQMELAMLMRNTLEEMHFRRRLEGEYLS